MDVSQGESCGHCGLQGQSGPVAIPTGARLFSSAPVRALTRPDPGLSANQASHAEEIDARAKGN
jgi:hypothetical protein